MEPLRLPNPIQLVRLANRRIVDVTEETGIENRDARRESIDDAIDTVRKRTQRLACVSNVYDLVSSSKLKVEERLRPFAEEEDEVCDNSKNRHPQPRNLKWPP